MLRSTCPTSLYARLNSKKLHPSTNDYSIPYPKSLLHSPRLATRMAQALEPTCRYKLSVGRATALYYLLQTKLQTFELCIARMLHTCNSHAGCPTLETQHISPTHEHLSWTCLVTSSQPMPAHVYLLEPTVLGYKLHSMSHARGCITCLESSRFRTPSA